MKLFGFEIALRRNKLPAVTQRGIVQPWDLTPTRWFRLFETNTGDWQRGIKPNPETMLTFSALYACVTLIAADVAKLGLGLIELGSDGVWRPTTSPSFSPVLRKPNRYQNHIQFFEQWLLSKLMYGNTYVLKVRDNRQVVIALYVLDPSRVQTFVSPGAEVFYKLQSDNLSPIDESVMVPASEIIHDRQSPLFHPLVGVSPITACSLAAYSGLEIQNMGVKFFKNGARPGGILSAPGTISEDVAARMKKDWETEFSGDNAGKVAVLGDGLKFETMAMTAVDAQLIEQLKYNQEMVCTAFKMPGYKIGVGVMPTYQNGQVANLNYYSGCLQKHIEDIELCLREGLDLPALYDVQFEVDDLLRMDSQTQMTVIAEGIKAGVFAPNEGRKKMNLGPVKGGETPYLQVQNYSLAALARRDAKDDPFAAAGATTQQPLALPAPTDSPSPDEQRSDAEVEASVFVLFEKERRAYLRKKAA